MGFLEAGTPLPWPRSLKHIPYVREHGIIQFLNTFHRVRGRQNDVLKWGDEIEYHLIKLDGASRSSAVALIAPELVAQLEAQDAAAPHAFPISSAWRPEYGAWMVEATPGAPYGGDTAALRQVEVNMAMRRYRIAALCPPGVAPFSIVAYPLLGASGVAFTDPPLPPGGPFSRSAYVPDACISPHPRFGTLTANIRKRRGRKVPIQVPLLPDSATPAGLAVTDTTPVPAPAAADAAAAVPAGGPGGGMGVELATRLAADASQPEAVRFAAQAELASRAAGDWDADGDVGPALAPQPSSIHMDAMAFGMGCCCLQVTFQARDLAESRYLYDMLHVLSPLFMALTANAPVWRGFLAATDTRWDVIAASVDCRTPKERGCDCPAAAAAGAGDGAAGSAAGAADAAPAPGSGAGSGACPMSAPVGSARHYDSCAPSWLADPDAEGTAGHGGTVPLTKSRYSSIDCFISSSDRLKEALHNDIPLAYSPAAYAQLRSGGVDDRLSKHIASLFTRDPLVIFSERVAVEDSISAEHFENIQSTNWRSVRWKPPPPDAAGMGWRVELRTMEAQVSDFENAAFTVLVVLLSRVILSFDLNLYVPLSAVEENFRRAAAKDAASTQRFFFRKHIMGQGHRGEGAGAAAGRAGGAAASPSAAAASPSSDHDDEAVEEMTAAEILLGKGPGSSFPGLLPLVFAYLDVIECDAATRAAVDHYARFVAGRASGDIMTGAAWQRAFIARHPEYKHDSAVPPAVVHDMLAALDDIANARVAAPELLGALAPPPITITAATLAASPSASPEASPTTGTGSDGSVSSASSSASSATSAAPAPAAAAPSGAVAPASPSASSGAAAAPSAAAGDAAAAAAGAASAMSPGASARLSAALASYAAAASAGAAADRGVKMRGRSFAEEVAAPSHPLIRRLLERFTLPVGEGADDGRTFEDVPAFLGP